jgi:O-antigen/teichoic acid export membrane protein
VNLSFNKVKGTLFNFSFRSGGIVGKFLLIVYISKSMSFQDLGLYNILAVTVAWSVYMLGFEFYSYSLRHIVGERTTVIASHVFNQLIFHCFAYVLLLITSPLLVALNFIPLEFLAFFIFITIFDQLSQEFFRICVALDRSQFANFIYFIKTGLWIYPLMGVIIFKNEISINLIFTSWLIGTVAAFLLGACKLYSLQVLKFQKKYFDLRWIKKGLIVAFPFLIISVAQITMDFSDRYLIDYFLGKEQVGIYSFFYGIANVPITLITSVLVAQYYPKVINAYKFDMPIQERKTLIRNFLFQCIGFALIMSLVILFFIHYLLDFIGKEELVSNIGLFYMMLIQVVIFAVQVVVQTVLYARHEDRFLLYSAIAGAVLNIVLNLFLISRIGIMGAVISTIASMCIMLVWRLSFFKRSNTETKNRYGKL